MELWLPLEDDRKEQLKNGDELANACPIVKSPSTEVCPVSQNAIDD